MPRSYRCVVLAVAVALGAATAVSPARAQWLWLRVEGGRSTPDAPETFATRYEPAFTVRVVDDTPLNDHLSVRCSFAYSEFAHARLRTHVSGGRVSSLSNLWGLTAWPMGPKASVRPYGVAAVSLFTGTGLEYEDVAIDTGSGPRTVDGTFELKLAHSVEIGTLVFAGASPFGVSLAVERVSVHTVPQWTSYLSYTAGVVFRYGASR